MSDPFERPRQSSELRRLSEVDGERRALWGGAVYAATVLLATGLLQLLLAHWSALSVLVWAGWFAVLLVGLVIWASYAPERWVGLQVVDGELEVSGSHQALRRPLGELRSVSLAEDLWRLGLDLGWADGGETRIRLPHHRGRAEATLRWLQEELDAQRLREGGADDIPEALRSLRGAQVE